MKYTSSLQLKLIYVFRINNGSHLGCLKIGETTTDENIWGVAPNSKSLNAAARKRIDSYTQTAGISYDLLHTEVTIYNDKGTLKSFNDKEVHQVLIRSGIKKKVFDKKNKANEWFITDLETVKKAISAVKEGRASLHSSEITESQNPIVFRPEQQDAIDKTIKRFNTGNQMLWFAKMRFGKTLSALQVVKEMGFKRTLILTHRPVVDKGWFEDFGKIFYDTPDFSYGSKDKGDKFQTLENKANRGKTKFIYFASIQDLRGSELVGGNFNKNDEIFSTSWDLIIIDEAHEGTQTELGQNVIRELNKEHTKQLHLSGTPFNLLDDYAEDEIYTWDYVMEQRAKEDWDKVHFGDPNPYASLPKLNIFTFDLGNIMKEFIDEDVAFNFREFFRVNDEGEFVHRKDVNYFLNMITKKDNNNNYPFSTEEYRENFRHSLWMVPGVKEARALSTLLKEHSVFSSFEIVNVAGDGDLEEESKDALKKVEDAISEKPHETYTITLSCGRLTTGVSVKAWTAVLMLSGSYNTSASSYMQTIFRVQTPATINGRVKEECFVFDFAPDRTLKVIAETAKISSKAGKTSDNDRDIMGDFLNFCPIISVDGTKMEAYNVNSMLEQLKNVYVEKVVRNGFEDSYLYNNDMLMKLEDVDLQEFDNLKKTIGTTKAMPKSGDIDINKQGFTDEEYEKLEKAKNKKKSERTEEDNRRLEEKKEKDKLRQTAISILRGISIRMPLLIYGADIRDEDEQLSIDNFTKLVDDQSWDEFMPNGVTKSEFNKFKKYYEPDVFRAAGKRIRAMARAADNLTIEARIERITAIFANFRNPDKETVLTPWRVVNMHLGDCLGGYSFLSEDRASTVSEPIYIDYGEVTANVFNEDAKILEINSKSGLYPLYMTYSIYKNIVKDMHNEGKSIEEIEEQHSVWDKVVKENIFVICKTPMAKSITKRTLVGFRDASVNTRHFNDLVNQITNKEQNFLDKIKKGKSYWKANNNDNMKFNAIVGNPPYQDTGGSGGNNDAPIYQYFSKIASAIRPEYISLIIPSRWFAAGRENLLGDFRKDMINSGRIQKIVNYTNSRHCFTNVEIKGGVCYYLETQENKDLCDYTIYKEDIVLKAHRKLNSFDILIREPQLSRIIEKVETIRKSIGINTVDTIVSADTPFGVSSNPEKSKKYPIKLYSKSTQEHNTTLFYIENLKRKTAFINRDDIKKNKQDIDKFKVFINGAAGSGEDAKVMGEPEIAPKNSVCSQSYLYSAFDTVIESIHFIKYIKSKFFRAIVSSIKITQSAPSRVYRFVLFKTSQKVQISIGASLFPK